MAKTKRALKNILSRGRDELTAKGKAAFEKRRSSVTSALACAEVLNRTMIIICKDGKILLFIIAHFLDW